MKKLFVAAALVMGLGTSAAFADNFMVDSRMDGCCEQRLDSKA